MSFKKLASISAVVDVGIDVVVFSDTAHASPPAPKARKFRTELPAPPATFSLYSLQREEPSKAVVVVVV